MPDHHSPEAGWYDDPERALRIRWWDGTRWTTHTRAKQIADQPLIAMPRTDMSSTDELAVPDASQSYGYSAPFSASPSLPSAEAHSSADSESRGTFSSHTRHPHELWSSSKESMEYVPARATTAAAWALSVTPLVTVLSQTAAVILSGFESTPAIWIIGATIIPILWIIMWVRRDRITLHEWGHLRRAHWGWAFLGAFGYLIARTIVVTRQTKGRGWGPLAVIAGITVVLVSVGLFYSPIIGILGSVTL